MKQQQAGLGSQKQEVVPDDLKALLGKRDGAAQLLQTLPKKFPPKDVAATTLRPGPGSAHNAWETCGYFYLDQGRPYEAIAIFQALYEHLLLYQQKGGKRAHKGSPLVFLSDCYLRLNYRVVAKRYLMLALCEDSILNKGKVQPETTGVYFRAVWSFGLTDRQVRDYAARAWNAYKGNKKYGRFPEWLLQEIESNEGVETWMTEYPSPSETAICSINRNYASDLLKNLGGGDGKSLERLACYLLSAMPGCRARMRMRSPSTDYDVIGFLEGHFVDFRADLGRYCICECKDWSSKADFTAIAKFCRVLESAKSNCGIIFSKQGVSGERRTVYAERELLKVFQDRGIAILVVSLKELQEVAKGRDFIEMLRSKYEAVRLDLQTIGESKNAQKK